MTTDYINHENEYTQLKWFLGDTSTGTWLALLSRPWPLHPFGLTGIVPESGKQYSKSIKMAVFGITSRYIWFAVPLTGFLIGKFLDDQETLRMTNFRDKSVLYAGRVKDGDLPSWP